MNPEFGGSALGRADAGSWQIADGGATSHQGSRVNFYIIFTFYRRKSARKSVCVAAGAAGYSSPTAKPPPGPARAGRGVRRPPLGHRSAKAAWALVSCRRMLPQKPRYARGLVAQLGLQNGLLDRSIYVKFTAARAIRSETFHCKGGARLCNESKL